MQSYKRFRHLQNLGSHSQDVMAVDPSETRVGSGFQAFVKLSKTADENMLYNMFSSAVLWFRRVGMSILEVVDDG